MIKKKKIQPFKVSGNCSRDLWQTEKYLFKKIYCISKSLWHLSHDLLPSGHSWVHCNGSCTPGGSSQEDGTVFPQFPVFFPGRGRLPAALIPHSVANRSGGGGLPLSQAQEVRNQEGPYCFLPGLLIWWTEILCLGEASREEKELLPHPVPCLFLEQGCHSDVVCQSCCQL